MTDDMIIPLGSIALAGTLSTCENALGIALFAHGSGSSRFSPRNQFVAKVLNRHRIATLLADLLTADEERVDEATGEHRFNIPLLAQRLGRILDWMKTDPRTKVFRPALFGASTGAAAALIAAADRGTEVASVVSRGGRPDLAKARLPQVRSPPLLIVGERDASVIRLNQEAYDLLACPKEIAIVKGATHLFEEPGCLEQVAGLACRWFTNHFG